MQTLVTHLTWLQLKSLHCSPGSAVVVEIFAAAVVVKAACMGGM